MRLFGLDIRRAEKRGSLEDPATPLGRLSSMLSEMDGLTSGQAVTPTSAMTTAVVYSCVRVISESVASLPLHVYRRKGNRQLEVAEDLPLYRVLHDQPNEFQTSFVYREAQQARTCLWGNSYAQIVRDIRTGNVIGLLPLPPHRVRPKLEGLKKVYEINGGEFVLQDEDVLHIPGLSYDGVCGLSPIALMRRAVGQAMAQDQFGETFYQNGTRLSGVLEHPGKLNEEVLSRLKTSWTETYAGKMNAGKVAILEEGMKFNALTMPMEDAQFVETRKFQVSEIARIFRVPPHMVGDMQKSTFNNMEQQSIAFVRDTMMAWLVRWEQECNRKLLTERQQKDCFIKFNVGGLLRGDLASRYQAYKVGREGGWLSVNDIRELEDMNAVEGGDTYIQPLNYTQIGSDKPADAPKEAPKDPLTDTPPTDPADTTEEDNED